MKKIFFIGDTHFGHEAIIRYENRPFTTLEEMDEVLIRNWNSTVGVDDEVFLVGDFSAYDDKKSTEICSKLNGVKTLILGNHDIKKPSEYIKYGFEFVSKYPIIIDGFYILSHEPLYVNSNMPYGNIFGHVHSNKAYHDYTSQSFCVCVERIQYRPIEFSKIKESMGGKYE